MERLKPNDKSTLQSLFKISQKGLLNTLHDYLIKKYEKVIVTKKYICAIGDIPIALVAHCDTVFSQPPINIFYDSEKNVMWSPEGLGADDRAGVFAIIKIIRSGLRPHIIFTTDEEQGGIGATQLIFDYPQPFAEIKYIIQLDRRGTNDCVFYDCYNDNFIEYIESFGFCENWGTFSDISIICPEWKIAGVNLSIGYQDEHNYTETLWIGPLFQTINKVILMLKDAKNINKYEYFPLPYGNDWYQKYLGKEYKNNIKCVCGKCHNEFSEYDVFPVKTSNKTSIWVCINCIENFNWCERCGEAYESSSNDFSDILCKDCSEKLFETRSKVVNV